MLAWPHLGFHVQDGVWVAAADCEFAVRLASPRPITKIQGMQTATRWIPCAVVLFWACGDGATTPDGEESVEPCTVGSTRCAQRLEIGPDLYLPVFRTYPLDSSNSRVTQAVIVIHGTNRNADTYFQTMVTAARVADRLNETLVAAPHFQIADDFPALDEPYWTNGGWKRGHLSLVGGPTPRVSSYAALDRLLEALADGNTFPRLTGIVVTGHSAGGQVTHRFAAGSQIENQLSHVAMRYVVANPSSYLYLGPEREVAGSFAVPVDAECPTYNNWHYGLSNLNTYMSALEEPAIRAHLTERDVTILLGDADTGDANLDESCAANLQGPNRYQRGLRLLRYMDALHPGHRHVRSVVPGVGHSSFDMYTSQVGLAVLFGS